MYFPPGPVYCRVDQRFGIFSDRSQKDEYGVCTHFLRAPR